MEVAAEEENALQRETVYAEWLNRQFQVGNAAKIIRTAMDGFRLTCVIRKTRDNDADSRKSRSIIGPDALFRGELQVADSVAFSQLVTRGIGRHRAFGFGMLLLKPAQLC